MSPIMIVKKEREKVMQFGSIPVLQFGSIPVGQCSNIRVWQSEYLKGKNIRTFLLAKTPPKYLPTFPVPAV